MSSRSYLERLLDGATVEWRPLGEVVKLQRGKRLVKSQLEESGGYAVYQNSMTPLGYHHESNAKSDTTFVISAGAAGEIGYSDVAFWAADDIYFLITPDHIEDKFLYYFLLTQQNKISAQVRRASVPRLSKMVVENIPIPIPCPENPAKSLAIQAEIVRILDAFTELIAELNAELIARKQQYTYYRDQLLHFELPSPGGVPEGRGGRHVEWKTLGELAQNLDYMRKPITSGLREAGDIPYYGASGIVDYVKDNIFDGDYLLVSEDGANLIARNTPIAFSISGKSWVNNHAHILKFQTYEERRYVEYHLNSIDLTPYISGAAQPKLNQKNLSGINIPNPSFAEKCRIVAILDTFDTLVNSISEGLPREIALRQQQYEYYRDLLLSFPKPDEAEA